MLLTGLAVGLAVGWAMQRGRFCVTGMIRDIFLQKSWRGFTALLIVIAVHAIGLAILTSTGVITPEFSDFAPAAVVIGGTLFGMGIVLAGGCASGTWYRTAEGLVGSWLALLFYGLSAAAMKGGALDALNTGLKKWTVPATTLNETLGISVWWLVIPFAAFVAGLAWHFLKEEEQAPQLATLKPKKTGIAHLLAEKPWHFFSAAVVIGILGVIAWPLSAATGRNTGLGITSPSADLSKFVITGDISHIDWGVLLVIGLFIGAYFAAKSSGEFRLRLPTGQQALRSVGGGILMGVGASAAGGCTVGNGMVQTSLFSYQGWIALLFFAVGIWLAAKIWLKPSEPINEQDVAGTPGDPIGTTEDELENSTLAVSTGTFDTSSVDEQQLAATGGQLGFRTTGVALLERPKTKAVPGLTPVGERTYKLDTLGAVCPFPLIDAKVAMEQLDIGERLRIDFDCTQATDAIPRWAAEDGHQVTNFEQTTDAGWTITVQKV